MRTRSLQRPCHSAGGSRVGFRTTVHSAGEWETLSMLECFLLRLFKVQSRRLTLTRVDNRRLDRILQFRQRLYQTLDSLLLPSNFRRPSVRHLQLDVGRTDHSLAYLCYTLLAIILRYRFASQFRGPVGRLPSMGIRDTGRSVYLGYHH